MKSKTLWWCSLIIFEVCLLTSVELTAPKTDKIHLTDGIDIGGIWKTKMHWKAHWVKHWESRQMWIPIWRKIWTPVEMKEWVPLPPPAKSRHWNTPSY